MSKRQGADIAIQRDDLERWMRRSSDCDAAAGQGPGDLYEDLLGQYIIVTNIYIYIVYKE